MNEPFSEKSARQLMRQSGQFSVPPQEDTVSAQSVSPQNRQTNGQKNYQMNHSVNRPATLPMNYQSPRKELYAEGTQANRYEGSPYGGQNRTRTGGQNIPENRARAGGQNIPENRAGAGGQAIPDNRAGAGGQTIPDNRAGAGGQTIPENRAGTGRAEYTRNDYNRTTVRDTTGVRMTGRQTACEQAVNGPAPGKPHSSGQLSGKQAGFKQTPDEPPMAGPSSESKPANETSDSGANKKQTADLRIAENTDIPLNAKNINPPRAAMDGKAAASAEPEPAAKKSYTVAYQAAMPYPPIRVSGQNPQYATAMLDNMSGQNSELTAVGLYFYDHLLTAGFNDVSEAFHHMNIVEMHHMEIFAKLAMQLGENPRFWSRQPRSGRYIYWNPACIHYPNIQPPAANSTISQASLRLILSQAIECEQAAIRKYMQQTNWIQDVNICDNLRRISADEQMHVDILTRLYHSI